MDLIKKFEEHLVNLELNKHKELFPVIINGISYRKFWDFYIITGQEPRLELKKTPLIPIELYYILKNSFFEFFPSGYFDKHPIDNDF